MPDIREIPISSIVVNDAAQFRVTLNPEAVAEYAEAMKAGEAFPPVVVFTSDDPDAEGHIYYLADGFHRIAAASTAGLDTFRADVHEGGLRGAVLHSLSANSVHGLRRTNDDKYKAVVFALRDPELRQKSQHEIARLCGVSQAMVSKTFNKLFPKPKAESDNGYQPAAFDTPEQVVAALEEGERAKVIDHIMRTAQIWDKQVRQRYERLGLVTDYAGGAQYTPLAKRVLEALVDSDDPWTKLERELWEFNQTLPERERQHLYGFGSVKPALEKLVKLNGDAGGWVDSSAVGFQYGSTIYLLAMKGYVRIHAVKRQGYGEDEFHHITADGCGLLGLPALPIPEPPTAEEIAVRRDAERRAREEAWRLERQAREAERAREEAEARAAMTAEEVAEAADEERRWLGRPLDTLRDSFQACDWLAPDMAQIEQYLAALVALIKGAPIKPFEAPDNDDGTDEPEATRVEGGIDQHTAAEIAAGSPDYTPEDEAEAVEDGEVSPSLMVLEHLYEEQRRTGDWVPLMSFERGEFGLLANFLSNGCVLELLRVTPSGGLAKWYQITSMGCQCINMDALPDIPEPPADQYPGQSPNPFSNGDRVPEDEGEPEAGDRAPEAPAEAPPEPEFKFAVGQRVNAPGGVTGEIESRWQSDEGDLFYKLKAFTFAYGEVTLTDADAPAAPKPRYTPPARPQSVGGISLRDALDIGGQRFTVRMFSQRADRVQLESNAGGQRALKWHRVATVESLKAAASADHSHGTNPALAELVEPAVGQGAK